jgi:hypothetical protein
MTTATVNGRPRPTQKFDRSIVEGPIGPAVWRLAWPTMLQNAIAGLQGIIDHAMVGHFVGYTANAAIGVSWQIILVVIVFISSLFTGMAVLVRALPAPTSPRRSTASSTSVPTASPGRAPGGHRHAAAPRCSTCQRGAGGPTRRCPSCARCSWASSA